MIISVTPIERKREREFIVKNRWLLNTIVYKFYCRENFIGFEEQVNFWKLYHLNPKIHAQQVVREPRQVDEEEKESHSGESLEAILKSSRENNHLAQWVRNSHQIPPPDHEGSLEEWTAEELAARAPRESNSRSIQDTVVEEIVTANSDVEQQSTASSASLSTVKSNSMTRKNGSHMSSKENSTSSISICRRCHRCAQLILH